MAALLGGAAGPNRTDDLTLTKRLLYQLSYSGGMRIFYRNALVCCHVNNFLKSSTVMPAKPVPACRKPGAGIQCVEDTLDSGSQAALRPLPGMTE